MKTVRDVAQTPATLGERHKRRRGTRDVQTDISPRRAYGFCNNPPGGSSGGTSFRRGQLVSDFVGGEKLAIARSAELHVSDFPPFYGQGEERHWIRG